MVGIQESIRPEQLKISHVSNSDVMTYVQDVNVISAMSEGQTVKEKVLHWNIIFCRSVKIGQKTLKTHFVS